MTDAVATANPDNLKAPQARFGREPSNKASVYFIAGAGMVKIGYTVNLTSRVRCIRNSSPVPLELLGTIAGGSPMEGMMHMRFQHLRRHGEWFEDNGEIREYLASMISQRRAEGTR